MRIFILILICILFGCETSLKQKKINELKKVFKKWSSKDAICNNTRTILLDNYDTILVGDKLKRYNFDTLEIIDIFGKPDSIFRTNNYFEYIYYKNVLCYKGEVLEIACISCFLFTTKNNYLNNIYGKCW